VGQLKLESPKVRRTARSFRFKVYYR